MLVAPELTVLPRAGACPYRGLMAFEPEDGDLFFGREEVVATTVSQTLEGGFMAVVGSSGSGKSSLIGAGLIPAYRRAREGSVAVMTPGSDPEATLRRSVGSRPPSLLVVDQLEEAFTLCPDEARRGRFFDALIDLFESGSTAVVVALRADFYGRCAEHPRLAAALAAQQLLLGPMQPDELRRAIEGPAGAAGLRLEAGLVDTMLADVEGEPGALPLLSHALYESWARRDGRVLTRAGYVAAGGVRGAIAHTAEDVFVSCSEQEQVLMRRMFVQLTELGETTEDTRRRVPLTELIPEGEGGREMTAVLDRLAGSRLLVVGDDSAEIAHEALIREWPRLRGWLAEDREELRARRQLTAAARSWDEAGRNEADLYRGPRLAAAVELAGEERPLTRVEREFLDAGRAAQDRELESARRRARRLRILLAAVAVALVVALIAGSFALVQRGSARRSATVAQAGRLAAQSREAAGQHPDLALLLALEAGRRDDSIDTRGALLGALEKGSRIGAWLREFDSPPNATAFSPDGRLLAAVTLEGTTLWNTATWRPLGPPLRSSQGGSSGVDFSPDGRTLAIAGGEGNVELWDVESRRELRQLVSPRGLPLHTVRYSPDGSVIAGGGIEDNHVTLWDAVSGRVIGAPIETNPPQLGGAQSIAFSPDSKRIAVPGATGTVGLWDVTTGNRVGRPLVIGEEYVAEAIFAEGGRTVIASDDSGSVSTVDVATGRPIGRPLSVGDEPADSLDLSPDGRLLAAASFDGSVFVWDTKTGIPFGSPLTADTSPINDVEFSPDGRTLVSSHVGSAVVWNMGGEQAIGKPLGVPADLTTDVSFSHDGTRLAVGRFDGKAIVYDAETRRQVRRIAIGSVVTAVAFHPSENLLAVGTIDGKVRFFDPRSGRPSAPSCCEELRRVADRLQPGRRTARGGRGSERRGRVLRPAAAGRGSALGRGLPTAGGTCDEAGRRIGALPGLRLGRNATGDRQLRRSARPLGGEHAGRHGEPMTVTDDGVLGVAFDRSGRLVAGGGATGPVRVWRVDDQQPAFPPLSGHTGPVTGVAFDPAGSFLATSSAFGGTRLWDPATGLAYGDELVGSARPLTGTIDLPFLGLRSAFSPDGKRLAVPGVNERGMLWDVDPAVWRERACAIAGRNLSREEWGLYLPSGTPYRATCSEWPPAEPVARPGQRPCRTVRNCSLRATNVGLPGDRAGAPSAPCSVTVQSRREVRDEIRAAVSVPRGIVPGGGLPPHSRAPQRS